MVNPEKQSFRCWGCGESGDVYTFVMKTRGISFPETLQYLGTCGNLPVGTNPLEVKRRELVKKFNSWCSDYSKYICERLRLCNRIDALMRTPENLAIDGVSEMYLLLDVYQYHLAILGGADDKSRFELYQEVKFGTGI